MKNRFVVITGIPEVQAGIKQYGDKMYAAAARALYAAGNDVARQADSLVPVDTGILRGSQDVKRQKNATTKNASVTITYGGPANKYAIVQHERLDFWHPPKPPGKSVVGGRQGTGPGPDPNTGRGPKYLEKPFMEETGAWPGRLVTRIRAEFGTA